LARHAEAVGETVTFNKEALAAYLAFATSPEAAWSANFRDFGASVTRLATLASSRRINETVVVEEIERLRNGWRRTSAEPDAELLLDILGVEKLAHTDLFDSAQLASFVRVCRESKTLSAAGRKLFAASRTAKTSTNDADRLKKYVARFGLNWDLVASR
jgi:transcriptional regulatory protein RtcR